MAFYASLNSGFGGGYGGGFSGGYGGGFSGGYGGGFGGGQNSNMQGIASLIDLYSQFTPEQFNTGIQRLQQVRGLFNGMGGMGGSNISSGSFTPPSFSSNPEPMPALPPAFGSDIVGGDDFRPKPPPFNPPAFGSDIVGGDDFRPKPLPFNPEPMPFRPLPFSDSGIVDLDDFLPKNPIMNNPKRTITNPETGETMEIITGQPAFQGLTDDQIAAKIWPKKNVGNI
jgi:hypothetical protein